MDHLKTCPWLEGLRAKVWAHCEKGSGVVEVVVADFLHVELKRATSFSFSEEGAIGGAIYKGA